MRLDHREVVFRVGADQACFRFGSVVKGDPDTFDAVDHVQIGEDGAIVHDDDTRADRSFHHAVGDALPAAFVIGRAGVETPGTGFLPGNWHCLGIVEASYPHHGRAHLLGGLGGA